MIPTHEINEPSPTLLEPIPVTCIWFDMPTIHSVPTFNSTKSSKGDHTTPQSRREVSPRLSPITPRDAHLVLTIWATRDLIVEFALLICYFMRRLESSSKATYMAAAPGHYDESRVLVAVSVGRSRYWQSFCEELYRWMRRLVGRRVVLACESETWNIWGKVWIYTTLFCLPWSFQSWIVQWCDCNCTENVW